MVKPSFWIGETGRELRKDPDAIIVAMYLLTSPHANMIGLYYLPKIYIAHDTGRGSEGASKGLQRCIEGGFCRYDEATEMVFVMNMAQMQVATSLKPTDNRVKNIQSIYDDLPNNPFLGSFFEMYGEAFHLRPRTDPSPAGSPFEAPPEPLRSQEQEQEQEQEQNRATRAARNGQPEQQRQQTTQATEEQLGLLEQTPTPPVPSRRPRKTRKREVIPRSEMPADVRAVYDAWRHQKPRQLRSGLTVELTDKILERLNGYSVNDLVDAIRGNMLSPFHSGRNSEGKSYQTLELVMRDDKHVDQFIQCLADAQREHKDGALSDFGWDDEEYEMHYPDGPVTPAEKKNNRGQQDNSGSMLDDMGAAEGLAHA